MRIFKHIKKEPGKTSINDKGIQSELLSCEKGKINNEIIIEAQKKGTFN